MLMRNKENNECSRRRGNGGGLRFIGRGLPKLIELNTCLLN